MFLDFRRVKTCPSHTLIFCLRVCLYSVLHALWTTSSQFLFSGSPITGQLTHRHCLIMASQSMRDFDHRPSSLMEQPSAKKARFCSQTEDERTLLQFDGAFSFIDKRRVPKFFAHSQFVIHKFFPQLTILTFVFDHFLYR